MRESGIMAHRRFWDYEDNGTITNFRVKWFVGSIVVSSLVFGLLPAFIGGIAIWWPMIIGGAAIGAVGTLIAFTIDYVHDRKTKNG